jgi:hypothetical protein
MVSFFVGEMNEVTVATPVEERGAVLSVVYLINYIGLGGPVIAVGFLSLSHGLRVATRLAALITAILCLLLIPQVITAARGTLHRRQFEK